MRIRYHHPIPDFYEVDNPINPLDSVSDDFLNNLEQFILDKSFVGVSYSKLSLEFRKQWGIDWENIIILKYLMSEEILKRPNWKMRNFRNLDVKLSKLQIF